MIEIEVFARRCFFSYKIIKKTENNQNLGELLENANTGESERKRNSDSTNRP